MTDTSKKSRTHSRAKLRIYSTEEGTEVKLNETDYLVTLSWRGGGEWLLHKKEKGKKTSQVYRKE